MKRKLLAVLASGLFIASAGRAWAAEPNSEQAQVIAEVQKSGGRSTMTNPDKPVTSVELKATNTTDARFKHLRCSHNCRNWSFSPPTLPTPG